MNTLYSQTSSLQQQAETELERGHYKEAIDLFSKLWQQSDDEHWLQKLADCYLQRAISFAQRGMSEQALALWDQYIQYAQPPYQGYQHYICWLIDIQNPKRLKTALKQLTVTELDQQYPDLSCLLGLLTVSQHPEIESYLPEQSIFIADLQLAKSAIKALHLRQTDELNRLIKQVPYRSAFKDLRMLLKGIQEMPESLSRACSSWGKIKPVSAYFTIAQLLSCSNKSGLVLSQALSPFNINQRQFITDLIGLNNEQFNLLEDLLLYDPPLTAQQQFELALKYKNLLDIDTAALFCKKLLIHFPKGIQQYNQHFTPLSSFEQHRLTALAFEQVQNISTAEKHWRLCIEQLNNQATADSPLQCALILRHLADLQETAENQNQLLIESLIFDQQDQASHLHILNYFKHLVTDLYMTWLQTALSRFPDDLEILTLSLQATRDQQLFQQQNVYAEKILNIDPLNSFAKHCLVNYHLMQARTAIHNHSYQQAKTSLKRAESLKFNQQKLFQFTLLQGLICFAEGQEKQGIQAIKEVFRKLSFSPLNQRFIIAIEALLTSLPVDTLLSTTEKHIPPQELQRFCQLLNYYSDESGDCNLIAQALNYVYDELEETLSQTLYPEETYLLLAQTLDKIHAFDLLQSCARSALEKYPTNTLWQYYLIYTENHGNAGHCSAQQIAQLNSIRLQALNSKQDRSLLLIDDFLAQYNLTHNDQDMSLIENILGLHQQTDDENSTQTTDPITRLYQQLSEQQQNQLDTEVDELIATTTLEQLAENLVTEHDSAEILAKMMHNPDLYHLLITLLAMDKLQLNNDVSINEIFAYFNLDLK